MVSEQPTPKPEMSKRGILANIYGTEASALNANAHSPTEKSALTTYVRTLPKKKVLSTPTGVPVQHGPRGRGRGRKALWGDENVMSESCKEQWLPVGGCPLGSNRTQKIAETSVILQAETQLSVKTAAQTPTRNSPFHSPGTSLRSNTIQKITETAEMLQAEGQSMQSKKRMTPIKTAKISQTPTRKSPRLECHHESHLGRMHTMCG